MIDPQVIIERAAAAFGTTPEALIGPRRFKRLAASRHAVAWALRQIGLTLMEIGELLHRDHSTIVFSIVRAEERAQADAEYAQILKALISRTPPFAPPCTVAVQTQNLASVPKRRDAWAVEESVHIALFWYGGIPTITAA